MTRKGYYEKAGAQGPYSVGIWSTWAERRAERPARTSTRRHPARAPVRARMAEPRSVVITGASRGLGFASAVRLYREGWRVVAAMRTPERGLPLLREATGAADDDDRLIGVQLDLLDAASITAAAKAIEEAVGAPYAHRAQRRDLRRRNGGGDRYGVVAEHVRHQRPRARSR